MRTSIGLASRGLLSRGAKPALHIASRGYLREPLLAVRARAGILLGGPRDLERERQERLANKNAQALALILAT